MVQAYCCMIFEGILANLYPPYFTSEPGHEVPRMGFSGCSYIDDEVAYDEFVKLHFRHYLRVYPFDSLPSPQDII